MKLIEGVNAKVCTKCGELKSFDGFSKQKSRKYGLTSQCKECRKLNDAKYYEKNKDKVREQQEGYRKENKEKIKEIRNIYYKKNKEELSEKNREYYKENKNRCKEIRKLYYEKNKDKLLEIKKKYRKENKDNIRETKKQYYKKNKDKYFDYRKKRRALKNNATGNFTELEFKQISLEFFDWECAYTGERILEDLSNCHREHVVPLIKGGDNGIWNIVPSLDWVNLSKHNSDLEDWYRKQSYFSQDRLNKIYEYMNIMEDLYKYGDIS